MNFRIIWKGRCERKPLLRSSGRGRAKYRVGLGSTLAISCTNNHSILWAMIHGILGWLYVIHIALIG
jgi:hypothetical protein